MKIHLKYGQSAFELEIDNSVHVDLIAAKRVCPSCDESTLIRSALQNPIGCIPLPNLVAPGQRVAIVTSDITRPCPSALLLPAVIDDLNRGGVRDEDILVVFALGTHRMHTEAERKQLVGEAIHKRVRCVDSDPIDCVFLGDTSRGTPVWVFRPLMERDIRVCLGNIEYHYFAGYSGGVKAIIPGVSNAETIRQNHRWMTHPDAITANLENNPVRADIEEAGEMVGVKFILNVILDENEKVVKAVAGHPFEAHRAGCRHLDMFGLQTINQPVDIVIVSAGGFPKDINLYQAQKALDNARHIVRPGGFILLVAECGEGLGNNTFEKWMHKPGGADAIIADIQREFVLGGHKAAAIAMAMKQAEIGLLSSMPADDVHAMGFIPFDNPGSAMHYALGKFGSRIAVMPEGGSVVPKVAPAYS